MLIENFDPILDDYAFFEAHSTEAEADLDAYKRHLNGVLGNSGLFRMLDFGCGAGSFTDRLLRQSASDPASIELTLVEPGAQARERAVQALRPYSKHAIAHFPELPAGLTTRFDFILANHVLYFVPDLTRTLRQLSRHVLPTGRFLVAMAGTENALIRCWAAGFGYIGEPIPYNISEDVEKALNQLGLVCQKEWIPYSIEFPDSDENRLKILRFLFGRPFVDLHWGPLLRFFDQYAISGKIKIETGHDLYVIFTA